MKVVDLRWQSLWPHDRHALIRRVGQLFSEYRLDTKTISQRIGYPESTVYNALAAWREMRSETV